VNLFLLLVAACIILSTNNIYADTSALFSSSKSTGPNLLLPSRTMASSAPLDNTKNDQSKAGKAVDEAFQALLSSQRDILAQLNFGSSMSELQFTDGPDNLPIVSPNASAEFHSSYADYDHCHYHREREHQYRYPTFDDDMGFQQVGSHHLFGVGDDGFILDQITIGPGEAKGPAMFDIHPDFQMRRRKRATEQELMGYVAQRKKRRNGSSEVDTPPYASYSSHEPSCSGDLLPGLSDLADLDESSSSLMLNDLDFPSIHSEKDASMWMPRERTVTENSFDDDRYCLIPTNTLVTRSSPDADIKPAKSTQVDAMDTDEEDLTKNFMEEKSARPRPPRRSKRSTWKPKRPASSGQDSMTDISLDDKRSMWKPRIQSSTSTPSSNNNSCDSLQLEDLELDKRPGTMTVSIQSDSMDGDNIDNDGDDARHCPPRTCSSDSTMSHGSAPTVKALSVALQQSIGSTKTIQAWDREMGLKRSHSKTMRLSCKSREQLLAFLKHEREDIEAAQNIPGNDEQQSTDEVPKKPAVVEL
jgi:hypothetical protein